MDKLLSLFQRSSVSGSPRKEKTICGCGSKLPEKDLTVLNSTTFHECYTVGQKLGAGGFGTVYAGTRPSDQKPVAIKILKRRKVKLWTMYKNESLPLEVVLLHRVRGVPGVCHLLDIFKDDATDSFIIVMERPARCMDLFDFISQKVMLTERQAVNFMHQLLRTLQLCHEAGVYHRDIKDENILIDLDSMSIKLIDFGSGAFVQEDAYEDYEGTRVYCPPEWLIQRRYHGLPLTVWSLGILLFDMVCGDVPFEHNTEIIKAEVKFPKHISAEVQDLIRLCLSVEPTARPSLKEIEGHAWFKRSAHPDAIPLSVLEETRRRLHPYAPLTPVSTKMEAEGGSAHASNSSQDSQDSRQSV